MAQHTQFTVTLLGLGEAGARYATGLRDSGYAVRGYDPFTSFSATNITQYADLGEAVTGADVVISLVGAQAASQVAQSCIPLLSAGTVFADFNTAAPELKAEIAQCGAARGVLVADVAVLAPVPRAGSRTPLMASGSGAQRLGEVLAASEAPFESIGGAAGDAAGRKLLRSVFMKGLAAAVVESLEGARAAGCEQWLREQIVAELAGDAGSLIDRLEAGSRQHAGRRVHEVTDAGEYLATLGSPRWVSDAARLWFEELLQHLDKHENNND